MTDGKSAWADEQEEQKYESELINFRDKVNTAERRSEVLRLLKFARERVNKLRGLDIRLTRFEHSLLDDACKALNKILD